MDTSVPYRLKEERKRLKLLQSDVAKICDVAVKTVGRWESEIPIPSDKISLLEENGFDGSYIVLGGRKREMPDRAGNAYADGEVQEKTKSYDSVPSRHEISSSHIDKRLKQVIDEYIREDTVATIVTTLDRVLKERDVSLDDDTKSRLVVAAQAGYERLAAGGRAGNFNNLLLALIDAVLSDSKN